MRGGQRGMRRPRSAVRPVAALLTLLVALLLGALTPPAPAFADDSSDIAALVNQERWSRGMAGLIRNADLDAVAVAWASRMAAANSMSHNPNTTSQIPPGWQSWGENVGTGYGSGAAMHRGWMNSERHKENVLGNFTDIGVGFVAAGGTWWGVEVFARYPGHAGPAAPPPAPAPAPAPPPAPEAEPAPAPSSRAEPPTPISTPTPTPPPPASATPAPPPSRPASASSSPTPTPDAASGVAVPPLSSSGGRPAPVPTAAVAAISIGVLAVLAGILLLPAFRRVILLPFQRRSRRR